MYTDITAQYAVMPFREKIKEASQYENDGAFTVRLKDGRVFSFSLSETEIFSKPYFQLAATDITEYKAYINLGI